MKGALIIFAATYISVFTLGLQSLNVNQGHYLAAAVTSFFISTGHILLYKHMPDPSALELVGYYTGAIAGITSSIWFHKRFKVWWPKFWQRVRTPRNPVPANGHVKGPLPWPPPPAVPIDPTDTH